ncbi:MAG: helix-turn-helix domain-containing protein, partial [Candidatus Bilamarchaeaceae archaeon]
MERIVLKMPTIKELKELREKLKITQKEAAAAVGIKQPYLARIENEDANPSYSLVCKLISFYEAVENKPKEKISQYYNPIIVYANANDKVIAAVRKMRKNDYSQLPVFSNGKSVGSISEGIVCREEIKKGKENVLDMKVAEIMGP